MVRYTDAHPLLVGGDKSRSAVTPLDKKGKIPSY